jgi:GNAT superfamily N-acetyltransferase
MQTPCHTAAIEDLGCAQDAAPTFAAAPASGDAALVGAVESWLGTEGLRIDLVREYPHVFDERGRGASICARLGGRPVAHAAALDVDAVGERGPCSLTLIGSVATDPARRGRGLATAVLERTIAAARARGRDAAVLWATRDDVYRRLGFRPAGRQWEVTLSRSLAAPVDGVRPAEARDLLSMWELHERKPWRVRRTLADMALLLTIPRMTTLVLERDGRAVAYACHGKGSDFRGWWHELGGDDGDVLLLLSGAMAALGLDVASALLPPYRGELCRELPVLLRRSTNAALVLPLTARGEADLFVDGLDSV